MLFNAGIDSDYAKSQFFAGHITKTTFPHDLKKVVPLGKFYHGIGQILIGLFVFGNDAADDR